LCSGLESGSYSLNRVRLHLLEHHGQRSARTLRRLLDKHTHLLATLLIANNIANYTSSAAMTVLIEAWGLSDWQVIGLNVLIVTPLLFIFCETLPKDLFVAHADGLMYRFAPVLLWMQRLFTVVGLQPLITGIGQLVMQAMKIQTNVLTFHPRRQVGTLVREGVGYGLLSDEQSALAERVLALAGRRVGDEMVPWSQVISVKLDDSPASLWTLADRTSVSRFPVLDGGGKVVGVLSLYDALLLTPETCPPIRALMKPVKSMPVRTASRAALQQMQADHLPLAIVTDRDKPVGIVTIKDLVEPVTGELAAW
jgi:CBS domain containing-hemolysin-like protein